MKLNMTKTIIQLAIVLLVTGPLGLAAQVVLGGETPDPSAALDLQSTEKGFLWSRLSTAERNTLSAPATGLLIFNTSTFCIEINQGTPSVPQWEKVKCRTGVISSLDCSGAVVSGLLLSGQAASGVSASVSYSGGNSGVHSGQTVTSTGVTGLMATLSAGSFATGAGSLTYAITGTPASAGTASFALNIGGQTCTLTLTAVVPGSVSTLDCAGATVTGTLVPGQVASGVSASVPYTGGNGGPYSGQTVTSTGVTGLTATLSGGNFASGSGSLSYAITGTPASGGTASFALNIGGQTCTLNISANYVCRAKVNATDYKNFMCHNLGAANTSVDPFTPTWEINGGYWQWGRSAQAAEGPTATDPKDGAVGGWNTTNAANGSWTDGSKTSNDPCPAGYRVPTKAQWDGVANNNTKTSVGTFNVSATNYGAGDRFGDQLMLPAAGIRSPGNGALSERGNLGFYQSSTTESGTNNAVLISGGAYMFSLGRANGSSVRCIEDTPGSIGTLDCSGSTVTGTLASGQAASGVSASVPYTGGNGGFYTGQTVTSAGVTGLTATLSAGNFGSGVGSLTYSITGTPASGGTASFALNIGGQTCTLNLFVCSGCCAKVSATEYKNFMCHNLGAANIGANPFTPSWEINGGYWQWGRSAQAAAGPTATDPKSSPVSGWNTTNVPDGSWADGSKTANDPCPSGYRVPTKAQWDGVKDNNTRTSVGTFSASATNYGAGVKFGDQLMLPAAGYRSFGTGTLSDRGFNGYYWSSTESSSPNAWYLLFNSSSANVNSNFARRYGFSVRCIEDTPGSVGALDCSGSTVTGTLIAGQPASGVSVSVPHTGGNGGFHSGQTVTSTGVTGLTATLSGGNFASGTGSLTYAITGTPAGVGTASFALNIGGQTCTLNMTVLVQGTIAALNCAGATVTGTLSVFLQASGVSASVPYTGGDGGAYSGQSVASTGVTGLTATLSGGNFASGTGSLTYAITGTPAGVGTASFALNIGGQTCTLAVTSGPLVCRAKVSATEFKNFMCYNLGAANTSVNPFTPTWEINGGYWQWGRSAQAAAGPTGPGLSEANAGAVSGWNATNAANGSWTDGSKTSNDPCPAGYRVPTIAQWLGVVANNTQTDVGTFNFSTTNYSAGYKFGDQMMLPATGTRNSANGALDFRGYLGYYWSSTEIGSEARQLFFASGIAGSGQVVRSSGSSVRCIEDTPGSIGTLDCSGSTVTGTLASGQAASGVSASVPYTGGDGGPQSGQTVASTGVTGLTATLSAGSFASGAGSLTYSITGTPASAGTASFALNIGGQTCTLTLTAVVPGSVSTLDCAGATVTGTLVSGQVASGVSASVPYTGGNGGPYSGQTVTSTGVTGLTATLSGGNFASGTGSLSYAITGTPASGGTASFALNMGGQTCTLSIFVCSTGCCAKVSATEYKNFLCHNLGAANTSADPFTPSWEINGGYWQWGRLAQAAAGPIGPGLSEANDAAISGWNMTGAANGSWADGSKTANDPCPAGYRIPTIAQWDGVVAHNTKTSMGTFTLSATNYGAGVKFGNQLTLPAAGMRWGDYGELGSRGNFGLYWSSTELDNYDAWYMLFNSSVDLTDIYPRTFGVSVRCIEDTPGSIGTLDCSGSTVTGTLVAGQAASGVSASVPYTGGDGGPQSGQTVASTGVTGLTATLSAGSFASGAGSLTYSITGTPASAGTASFALNIGGQTCTLTLTAVVPGSVSTLDCAGATVTGTLVPGQAASGVSASVPYTGGNSGPYSGQTVTSTGVTGLTATLSGGNFASGTGSLSYDITGTPASVGTASFALSIGGQTCTLDIIINYVCRAKVNATDYKNFLCYNLGAANNNADPFTPTWEINGGYWQWGINTQAAEGPTATDPKDGAVSGWNTTNAANGSWADGSKTSNDPCPVGYRVPTITQWDGVVANNIITNVGTFNSSATNYEAGVKFGDLLMLPAAGYRDFSDGTLLDRGSVGSYWSSTEDGTDDAWTLNFDNNGTTTLVAGRIFGLSVRCIAE